MQLDKGQGTMEKDYGGRKEGKRGNLTIVEGIKNVKNTQSKEFQSGSCDLKEGNSEKESGEGKERREY